MPSIPAVRLALVALGVVAVAGALAGCVPEPGPSASGTGASTSAPPSPTASDASPTPDPGGDITLPASCEQLYSAGMLQTLQTDGGPLNDPGVTLYSTQSVPALEILESGVPSLRCTWGAPGEKGLATSVAIIDADQAATIRDDLETTGYACQDADSGVYCRIQSQSVDFDDNLITRGETQFLRGNGWVSTAWVTLDPEGYTEDIVATLWG